MARATPTCPRRISDCTEPGRSTIQTRRSLVAGVGCDRGAPAEDVIGLIENALAQRNLAPESLAAGFDAHGCLRPEVWQEVAIPLGDEQIEVGEDGAFALDFEVAPAGRVDLVATDPAGNSTTAEVVVPVEYPTTQAIHLGADSWANEAVRAAVLEQMGEAFDAVVLDVKDECGSLSSDLDIDVALRVQNLYAAAFFGRYLVGDERYADYLTTEYARTSEPDVAFFVR